MEIAAPSVQSLQLTAMVNGQELGVGTGFVVEHDGRPYMITNYHIAAGRFPDSHPNAGQPTSSTGAVPDVLRVTYLVSNRPDFFKWEQREERVLDSEERALWLEHPVLGQTCDVVALPLKNTDGCHLYPYDLTDKAPALRAGPSDGVSIVGFPFGLTGGGAFAIWIRGFIASEPGMNFDNLPCILIDARTRPGQSGAPVIVYGGRGDMIPMADGSSAIFAGPVSKLLGVYSGRINEQSDLGTVWKAHLIEEILRAQKPGTAGL